MPEIHLEETAIRGKLILAWENTMYWLQRAFILEFTANKWDWPYGQSPRDIIDTAYLRNQTMTPGQALVSGTIYDWGWNADYALLVHHGGTFRDGRVYPARPWTQVPLQNLAKTFQEEFGKLS